MQGMNNSGQTAVKRYTGIILTVGWISAILSIVFYPFAFGVLGVIMGIVATKGGSRAGLSVIVASIILMAIGLIFGPVLNNYLMHYLGR